MSVKDRVSNPKSQGGIGANLPSEKPICTKCSNKQMGECLLEMDNCFGFGKSGHEVRYCPMIKAIGKKSNQSQERGPSSDAPKKNLFYALCSRGEKKDSPDVVTGMLQVFSIDVYDLLDPCYTLSLVTT